VIAAERVMRRGGRNHFHRLRRRRRAVTEIEKQLL